MKKIKIAICFLLSAIIMSGCSIEKKESSVSSEATSLNSAEMETAKDEQELKESSVLSETTSLDSAAQKAAEESAIKEEQELFENMPCIEISHEDFVNSLISSNNFKKQSEDSYMTTLSYKKSNIITEVIYQDTEISVISFNIDPAAVESNADDLKNCLQNTFELLGFTYSSDIPQVFLDNYEEETKKTEETGVIDPLIGCENSDENWGIVYRFYPEACSIEIRPYRLY